MKNKIISIIKSDKRLQALIFITSILIVYYIWSWVRTETTDNAYVEADITFVSSGVSGKVSKVLVRDNQKVNAGDVLIEIDQRDYKNSLDKAVYAVAASEHAIEAIAKKIEIAKINVSRLLEIVEFSKKNYAVSLREFNRTNKLTGDNFSSAKSLDSAKILYEKTKMELSNAELELKANTQELALLEIQKKIEEANLGSIKEGQKISKHAFDNTKIKAAIDGTITNIGARLGNFVRIGQQLAAIVPDDRLYIKANFKETQISHFKDGMRAYITFDSLSGEKIKGFVRSISPASGSKFSLIPQDNATGNFTKVVQRFPVIIDFKAPKNLSSVIRVGMSAKVSIKR
jgi:membrane fusion protein (multidrug efflux system)